MSAKDLDLWIHTIKVEAIDYWLNRNSKLIKLEILEK
jgi:hypothetical protein